MKRILPFTALAVSALSLASCARPQPVVERHYYHNTTTRYVPRTTSATVTTYKSAGVTGNAPETFEAVTPPSSYSR